MTTMSKLNLNLAALSNARPKKPCLSPKNSSSNLQGMRRNKISFGEAKTLVFEKEIDDQDEEHMNEVWFSKSEMKNIRKELKKSIKKGEISRGLEPYEGDMGAETKERRLNHMYSILDLQNQQKASGQPVCLQQLSRAMSANDIGRARQLASMDSTNAFQEYQNLQHKNQTKMIRTSSRGALDNFRKTIGGKSSSKMGGSKSMGRLDLSHFRLKGKSNSAGDDGRGNATFGGIKKKKAPNMLLQAMANKTKSSSSASAATVAAGPQAGVA